MNPGRSGSDKEIQAMTCNQKEDRTLLKRLTTIDMEEQYSMKLLDVKHRQIKTKQNRLRSRVNKITSKLPANQIAEFRTQEEQGRFRQEYNPIAASGAQRIAAASKRLKLQSERDRMKSGRCSFSERKSLQRAREAEFQPVTPRRPMSARVCIATAAEADTSKDVPRCDTARDAIPKEIHEEGAWATKFVFIWIGCDVLTWTTLLVDQTLSWLNSVLGQSSGRIGSKAASTVIFRFSHMPTATANQSCLVTDLVVNHLGLGCLYNGRIKVKA
ncbi:hypothetical protein CAPTEDRAFT_196762 [Capitella teleta]|uniref:Uncharacterized protein n=1 Tax=Capitella teleta TaxID=283909 RepID=R7TEN8_CAPTE|nr:hypothetical protein CAPTEDRAFT_196762 [Capitella teleta]|eukprot:ELT92194.1 hypothetical protein CAPTEDRAFT_196762 [Capitella teleta]